MASLMLVLQYALSNSIGSREGLQRPSASMWTEARRARGPCASAATSAFGYGLPPIVFCSILEAVPCSANAYWSNISRFVFIRHVSLCNCIAAVIAWSRDKVSHHWPGLISRSQADTGALTLSRKCGYLAEHQVRPPEERGPLHCRSYAGRRSLCLRPKERLAIVHLWMVPPGPGTIVVPRLGLYFR